MINNQTNNFLEIDVSKDELVIYSFVDNKTKSSPNDKSSIVSL